MPKKCMRNLARKKNLSRQVVLHDAGDFFLRVIGV